LKEIAASIFNMKMSEAEMWTDFIGWAQVLWNGEQEDWPVRVTKGEEDIRPSPGYVNRVEERLC
jgi:hypothetical protein